MAVVVSVFVVVLSMFGIFWLFDVKDISFSDTFISIKQIIITKAEREKIMITVRDPVCGMDVDTETALSAKIGDRTYYFCSQQCLDVYTAPERELKAMQRRVSFTLAGAVAALALKVLTLFGLITAIMYLDVVGGLRIYDIAIFIVSTPIVWIAGYRIYKGAYQSLRNRNINMDVLVTVGVLAGWIYGVISVFVLPTTHQPGTGYMEVAIGILAFVLLGQIHRRINSTTLSRFNTKTARTSTNHG